MSAMALEVGSTNAVISRNIKKLMADGKSYNAAVAISMRKAGKGRKKRKAETAEKEPI